MCDVTERASIIPSRMEAKDTHCHELTNTVSLTQLRKSTYAAYPNYWVTVWRQEKIAGPRNVLESLTLYSR